MLFDTCVFLSYLCIHVTLLVIKIRIMATLTFPQITLSPNILERLSQKAACSGKSLKAYIEDIVSDNAKESPSPSGDPWFDDPENIRMVEQGIAQYKRGNCRTYSLDEITNKLGL